MKLGHVTVPVTSSEALLPDVGQGVLVTNTKLPRHHSTALGRDAKACVIVWNPNSHIADLMAATL